MPKSQSKREKMTGPGPRVGHLDDLAGVFAEMAAVYREVRTGKTRPDLGCKLIYILREMRGCLEAQALERPCPNQLRQGLVRIDRTRGRHAR